MRFFFLWQYWLFIGSSLIAAATVYPVAIAGEESPTQKLALSSLLYISLLVTVTQTAALSAWRVNEQYHYILAGQTAIEAARKDRKYDVGAKKNWELVFGKSRLWMFGVSTSGLDIPLTVI